MVLFIGLVALFLHLKKLFFPLFVTVCVYVSLYDFFLFSFVFTICFGVLPVHFFVVCFLAFLL